MRGTGYLIIWHPDSGPEFRIMDPDPQEIFTDSEHGQRVCMYIIIL
jgi:hypothetical protein